MWEDGDNGLVPVQSSTITTEDKISLISTYSCKTCKKIMHAINIALYFSFQLGNRNAPSVKLSTRNTNISWCNVTFSIDEKFIAWVQEKKNALAFLVNKNGTTKKKLMNPYLPLLRRGPDRVKFGSGRVYQFLDYSNTKAKEGFLRISCTHHWCTDAWPENSNTTVLCDARSTVKIYLFISKFNDK